MATISFRQGCCEAITVKADKALNMPITGSMGSASAANASRCVTMPA
ncbi:MAG: hypothetical protein H8D37_06370 [Chloroflexi bacterium]|nr:hypothetical protein [Chloroflexota bacterium]